MSEPLLLRRVTGIWRIVIILKLLFRQDIVFSSSLATHHPAYVILNFVSSLLNSINGRYNVLSFGSFSYKTCHMFAIYFPFLSQQLRKAFQHFRLNTQKRAASNASGETFVISLPSSSPRSMSRLELVNRE
jgi:hypothetical protein